MERLTHLTSYLITQLLHGHLALPGLMVPIRTPPRTGCDDKSPWCVLGILPTLAAPSDTRGQEPGR